MTKQNGKALGVYIDGLNLFHAIDELKQPHLRWINAIALAGGLRRRGETMRCTVLFTAVLPCEHPNRQPYRDYLAASRAVGVEVVESHFKRMGKDRYQEKQTDVALALRMYRDAVEGRVTRIVLVTADSDQVPTVRAIREAVPAVRIMLAVPPGKQARELVKVAHESEVLTAARLRTCLLPRAVRTDMSCASAPTGLGSLPLQLDSGHGGDPAKYRDPDHHLYFGAFAQAAAALPI